MTVFLHLTIATHITIRTVVKEDLALSDANMACYSFIVCIVSYAQYINRKDGTTLYLSYPK